MTTNLNHYLKEEKFYKTVVEDGSDIILIVDFNAQIVYHNPSLKKTLGHSDVVGESFFDFIHHDDLEIFKEKFIECTKAPYHANVEFRFLCSDDTYKYLEFNSINLEHKDGIHAMLLDCRDISQRKLDQEELIRAQEAKQQFLANMSHEIRTPINGITGMVNLLIGSSMSDSQLRYIDAIKHSSENLKVIINDILDFSAIESGKLNFEKIGFDINYQIKALINSFSIQARDKELRIYYHELSDIPPVLLGDPVRFNQILINLVNNSLKFTTKGRIDISVSFETINNKTLRANFSVKDTGIGIEAEKLESIFETFKQADESITRQYGGTGLGLSICKQLVELQNGKISVNSTTGIGTEFLFSIPYEIGEKLDLVLDKEDVNLLNDKTGTLKGMRILLAEDNDINRLYAVSILNGWECYCDEAENGQIVLEKLKKNDYDLILMDVQMPVLDGLEASGMIRETFPESKSKIPIIAFTANVLEGDREKYIKKGMNDYISKPFIPSDLKLMLSKYYKKPNNQDKSIMKLTNLEFLKNSFQNHPEIVEEMVETFIKLTPSMLDDFESAVKNKNWRNVSSIAHKLKPTITFMGIDSIKELIVEIENKSLEDNVDEEMLEKEIYNVTDVFRKAIKEL